MFFNRKRKMVVLILAFSSMLLSSNCLRFEDDILAISENSQVKYKTYDIIKKYYNDQGGYLTLDLTLPLLTGDERGIPLINNYFDDKIEFFYDELPWDWFEQIPVENIDSNSNNGFFRSADYQLDSLMGHYISFSAHLDGGARGTTWIGIEGDTFDLNTGEKLILSDIFSVKEEEYMSILYDFVADEMKENIKEYPQRYVFSDAHSELAKKLIYELNPEDFTLTYDGLKIFYQKYKLSDGSGGYHIFEIPYTFLMDILSPELAQYITVTDAQPSFLVEEVFSPEGWKGIKILLSNKPLRIDSKDATSDYYGDDKLYFFPVGTKIACKWQNRLWQLRAFNNQSKDHSLITDWEYELVLTEEMIGKDIALKFPAMDSNVYEDLEWTIRVENADSKY